jgi:hypothetical protein
MRRTSATLVLLSLVGCGGAPAAVPNGDTDAAGFDAMLPDAAAPDATPFDPCGGGGPIEVRGNPESTITMTALTCTPERSFCKEDIWVSLGMECDRPQVRLFDRVFAGWYGFLLETDQEGNVVGASGAVYSTQDHYFPGEGPSSAPLSGWIQFQSIELCSLAGALEIVQPSGRVITGTFHVDSNPEKPPECR